MGALSKQHGVHHLVTNNKIKASVVGKFNRSLKSKVWQYFTANNIFNYRDALQALMKSYNQSYHRAIQACPVDVTPSKALAVSRCVYGTTLGALKKKLMFYFEKGTR